MAMIEHVQRVIVRAHGDVDDLFLVEVKDIDYLVGIQLDHADVVFVGHV